MRKMVFEISSAVSKNDGWKDYLDKNLHIGVELELVRTISLRDERNKFGVNHTDYHEYENCTSCDLRTTCGRSRRGNSNGEFDQEQECHKWFRNNLVIAIQDDGSLGGDGSEFLLHTGNLTTEEFMRRMPINDLVDSGYRGTRTGSIHCHLLIPYFKKKIPEVIFENTWNLFRYYYLGIAYLTGATRSTCTRPTDYCLFNGFDKEWSEISRYSGRDMFWLTCKKEDKKITDFNIEIRMFDDSVNLNHIALCRLISKLLLIRGSELAVFGKWIFKKDSEWEKKRDIMGRVLNIHRPIDSNTGMFMKNNAKELYLEFEHLMTSKETSIFMGMLRNPVWKSGKRIEKVDIGQDIFDELECLLTSKSITSKKRTEYYSDVATVLQTTPDMVRERLSKMGAKWCKRLGLYTLK